MLWFGWFGFNAGSALSASASAATAFGTTTIASASAMMTWIFFDRINGRSICFRSLHRSSGWSCGHYSGCGFVNIQESLFIGFISAIVSNLMVNWKALKK
jgi:Amt family ammonium transporter